MRKHLLKVRTKKTELICYFFLIMSLTFKITICYNYLYMFMISCTNILCSIINLAEYILLSQCKLKMEFKILIDSIKVGVSLLTLSRVILYNLHIFSMLQNVKNILLKTQPLALAKFYDGIRNKKVLLAYVFQNSGIKV